MFASQTRSRLHSSSLCLAMVSFKAPSILKHRRTNLGKISRTKQEQLGHALKRNKVDTAARKERLPRCFQTLRSSILSQRFGLSKDSFPGPAKRIGARRNIIRVSQLNFESVNKSPIVIKGPFMSPFNHKPGIEHPKYAHDVADLKHCPTAEESIRECQQRDVTASSIGSFGSWVEVSEVGSRPAVRVQVGLFSGCPSDSLLEGLQALLPKDSFEASGSMGCSLVSPFDEEQEAGTAGVSRASSFNEQSFVRMAEPDLGW